MAITIDWATHVISVPQADLTLVSGTLYKLDTDVFRLELKALEASVYGIVNLKNQTHNTEVTVAGTTFARTVEVLAPYSVTFTPDSQWSVRLEGSNNNIFDIESGILNQNQVQVIPTNSAGLIVGGAGGGLTAQQTADAVWDADKVDHQDVDSMGELQQADSSITEQDKLDISDRVWDELTADHTTVGTMGEKQGTAAVGSDVDAIWDEPTSNHQTPGSTGKALIDAGAGGNPWDSPISGSNTEGSFGYLLQTTIINYLTSILNKIATVTTNTIKRVTGSQDNQI